MPRSSPGPQHSSQNVLLFSQAALFLGMSSSSFHPSEPHQSTSSWRVVQPSLTGLHNQPAISIIFMVTTHKSMNKLACPCLQSLYLHMRHTSPGLTSGLSRIVRVYLIKTHCSDFRALMVSQVSVLCFSRVG